MAVNTTSLQRPADKNLYKIVAVGFPLVVLVGYFKSYYFSAFFDVPGVANALVHFHGLVMSLWVVYYVAQIALIRTRNTKMHMTMGLAGIALAAVVVVVGLATAYDAQLVRAAAPPGENPHAFFFFPVSDMSLFVIFFTGAIYYRKQPAAHKPLMVLTAINFAPAALFRVSPLPYEYILYWAFGVPTIVAILCLAWHTAKHGKLNPVFAAGVVLLTVCFPLRFIVPHSNIWLGLVSLVAP